MRTDTERIVIVRVTGTSGRRAIITRGSAATSAATTGTGAAAATPATTRAPPAGGQPRQEHPRHIGGQTTEMGRSSASVDSLCYKLTLHFYRPAKAELSWTPALTALYNILDLNFGSWNTE